MVKINKDNIGKFLEYYHNLHDSYITNINYSVFDSKIELFIDVCWSGEPVLKDDNTYETNKTKIKMIFNEIRKFDCREIFSWDYIDKVFLDYIILDDAEYICFSNNEQDYLINIVCEEIEYEKMNF